MHARSSSLDGPHWAVGQLFWPLVVFLLANIVLLGFGGDRWIADHVYAWEGGHWALKNAYWTKHVIHIGGKRAMVLAAVLLLAACAAAWRIARLHAWRRPLLVLLASVAMSTLLVSSLKHVTHMDCPWDLASYGGKQPFLGLFAARPAGLRASGCFPAGHASAGYAWVALYFFFLSTRPAWRWLGLGVGLAIGLVFGISQQLRGAHFMSHDVWTLMLCWLVAVAVHRLGVYLTLAAALRRLNRRLGARNSHVA